MQRDSTQVTSGITGIDQMLGQGLQRGGSTLIMGAAGTGKSTISLHYCIAAAERGEQSVYYVFDERLDTVVARAEGLNMDLQRHLDSGVIQMHQVNPAEISPGEFAHGLRTLAAETDLRLMVIDSLSGYLYSMPRERNLHLHLHELLSFLGSQGVTVFMTQVQHGLVGEQMQTPAELSFLADTVILLRYFEAKGEVRKAVSVFKKRAGPHETSIREIVTDRHGIHVGEPLRDFQGVLTGVPTLVGDERLQIERE
jgi:circadian clock protein KaiC